MFLSGHLGMSMASTHWIEASSNSFLFKSNLLLREGDRRGEDEARRHPKVRNVIPQFVAFVEC